MNEFMLDSLRDEQDTLLRLIERARQAHIPAVTLLDWALETVITAWRELRVGAIDWREAARRYQEATNAELECQMALTASELPDWAREAAERITP